MVKQYKWMFSPNFAILTLCVAIANVSVSYADGFYTIIGPDGRPMIVPSRRVDQEKQSLPSIDVQSKNLPEKTVALPVQKLSREKEL